MKKKSVKIFFCLLILFFTHSFSYALDLSFEPNKGQAPKQYEYLAYTKNYRVAFEKKTFSIYSSQNSQAIPLKFEWVGALANSEWKTGIISQEKRNYYHANQKILDLPSYHQLQLNNLYLGVDVVYYSSSTQSNNLQFDLHVQPGVSPKQIRFALKNNGIKLSIDSQGNLKINSAYFNYQYLKPYAYQWIDGVKKEVFSKFIIYKNKELGFELGKYDTSQTLVIDPVLTAATYIGGSSVDNVSDFEMDSEGYLYTVTSFISDYPESSNLVLHGRTSDYDCIISKIDPNLEQIVMSIVIGGDAEGTGNGNDSCRALELDPQGNIYIAGFTRSATYPVLNEAFRKFNPSFPDTDTILSKFSPDGRLLYSSYIGGGRNDDLVQAKLLFVDSQGFAYLSPTTYSCDFPLTANAFDNQPDPHCAMSEQTLRYMEGTLVKIDTTLSGRDSLIYSTYVGGTDPVELPIGYSYEGTYSVKADSEGKMYLVGGTSSSDFPFITEGAYQSNCGTLSLPCSVTHQRDSFFVILNSDGSLNYGTFLGKGDYDTIVDFQLEENENVVFVGLTKSSDWETTSNAIDTICENCDRSMEAFIARLNWRNSSLDYFSYLGGEGDDSVNMLKKGPFGSYILSFSTLSQHGLPLKHALQSNLNLGARDGFVLMLNHGLDSVLFGTYFGGLGGDFPNVIGSYFNHLYLGLTTTSNNLPIPQTNAISRNLNGTNSDGYLAKIDFQSDVSLSFDPPNYVGITNTQSTVRLKIENLGPDFVLGSEVFIRIPLGLQLLSQHSLARNVTCMTVSAELIRCLVDVLESEAGNNFDLVELVFISSETGNYELVANLAENLSFADNQSENNRALLTAQIENLTLDQPSNPQNPSSPDFQGSGVACSLQKNQRVLWEEFVLSWVFLFLVFLVKKYQTQDFKN